MNYSEVTKFNRVCARRQGYLQWTNIGYPIKTE